MKKLLKIVFKILLGLIIFVILLLVISPQPSVWLFARAFNGPVKITNKKLYSQTKNKVRITKNIAYGNAASTKADIYYPRRIHGKNKILYWVHGGGFIGGDKKSINEFGTYIASKTDTTVISINYTVAPTGKYPTQLMQLAAAVNYFTKSAKKYDLNKNPQVFVGGDSAGAQIAAQYMTIQTNQKYARKFSKKIVSKLNFKGAILYCGPYNFDLIQRETKNSNNWLMRWFVHTVGWSMTDEFFWSKSSLATEANIANYVTKNYPATYITDGNSFTFESSGKQLANSLRNKGVRVTERFFSKKTNVNHEYQFDFATKKAKKTLAQTIKFMQEQ